ncbi:putative beta-1,3-glucan-binding protein [Apostichopus japonicus]|uniref:Putative beta-1,3-glucan-binding protein n=1 Tax=Stichopus japonicus TaxID=307972 RepID=A0A2G8JDX5_STIJA|nr:putative beta-1,3-glucan-binding protein [Apostichopus japonicus]
MNRLILLTILVSYACAYEVAPTEVSLLSDGGVIKLLIQINVTCGDKLTTICLDNVLYLILLLRRARDYFSCVPLQCEQVTTPATTTAQSPTTTTASPSTSHGTTATTTQGSTTSTVQPVAGTLLFEDTFDTFDLDVWEHEITAGGGGNWEFQYYTNNRSNSYVRDNILYIKPTLTADKEGEGFLTSGTLNLWGASPADLCTGNNWYGCQRSGSYNNIINPIQSARLRTVNTFAFKYGKIEIEAQMPKGDWIWPAIWLLPKRNAYGQWPASGEIDLVECRGNLNLAAEDGTQVGVNQMGSTMHWGPYWPLNGWHQTHASVNLPDGKTFADGFHKYGLEWTSEGLKFYLDDTLILDVDPGTNGFWDYGAFDNTHPGIDNPWANSPNKLAPFDQEFYIIMNVAVGGTGYFSDSFTNTPKAKPWLNTSPTAAKDFYDAKADWYPTWNPDTNNGEDAAMKIKSVRVYTV